MIQFINYFNQKFENLKKYDLIWNGFFFPLWSSRKIKTKKKNKKSVYFLVETTLTYLIYAAGSLYFMVLAPHPSSSTEYKRHMRLFSPVFMFLKNKNLIDVMLS